MSLRRNLIRLAYANPHLRSDLLPLLLEEGKTKTAAPLRGPHKIDDDEADLAKEVAKLSLAGDVRGAQRKHMELNKLVEKKHGMPLKDSLDRAEHLVDAYTLLFTKKKSR